MPGMINEDSTDAKMSVFNPSRDGLDNEAQRTLYGQVLRFPSLPPAHAVFEGVTVFDTSTKDFYECQHIVTETENYYEWVAVTFGAARVFLIPVGKLTENDISEYTDKAAVDCVSKTINEIIYGLIRYHKHFCYLGYQNVPAGSILEEGIRYYGYKNNDLIDITGEELHKIYTGEVRKLESSEYTIGSVVEEDYAFFTKVDEPDMTDCVDRMNEIIGLLNKHFADIPVLPTDPYPTYDEVARVLNLIVEEVDPFAVPWQIVINRIWHLEQKVGNGNFVPNDDVAPVDFAGVWYLKSQNHQWLNVPTDIQDSLKYATICQINDTIFKIIEGMDGKIGDLITFLSEESVAEGVTFTTLVDYLRYVVAQIPEIRRRLELTLEGIKQLRMSLGNLGYILSTDTYFKDGTTYYLWNKVNMKMDEMVEAGDADEKTPSDLIYSNNQTFVDWHDHHTSSDVYAVEQIYVFSSEDTAERLIKLNAANIAENRRDINAINSILGTTLGDKFYIETISIPVVIDGVTQKLYRCDVGTSEDYGANKDTTFVEINPYDPETGDLKPYETLYKENGPIFVLGTPKVVCGIIEMNNREIAALNRRLSARLSYLEENLNVRPEKLKELTGVEGVTADYETWHVDGYKKVILPCSTRTTHFEPYTKYYKKVVVDDGQEYENHFISKWVVTSDTHYKAGKKYYKPSRIPPYNEPDEDNWIELIEGTDYNVGDPIENVNPELIGSNADEVCNDIIVEIQDTYYKTRPALFVELVEGVDYTVPNYVLTEDLTFDPNKTYFKRNIAGIYREAAKGTIRQYKEGKCSYWVNSYFQTPDKTFQEGKTYYSGDPELESYNVLTGGTLEQYNQGLSDYFYGQTVQDEGIYEFGSMTVPANEFYEYKEEESSVINRYSNVWVRDRRWKEYNTHRGLIDRNTDDIVAQQLLCGQFRAWTQGQIAAIKDFIMYMMLSTLEIVTQENSTFSLLHNTTAKLITILNAIAKLEGKEDYKHADGVYDVAYDYYLAIGFSLTTDSTFVPGKTYFIKEYVVTEDTRFQSGKEYYKSTLSGYVLMTAGTDYQLGELIEDFSSTVYVVIFREAIVQKYLPIPEDTYYEATDFRKQFPGEDFEIGLEVAPRYFTIDLVMPTVENYTMTEIKDAVNRVLRANMSDPHIPTYTALPIDQEIQQNIVYYRYVDSEWEKIVPEVDDPDMIGQRIKDYDPEHVWYIKMDEEIASDGYTMTWIRVMMNEMIRLYNRGAETFNNAFAKFAQN